MGPETYPNHQCQKIEAYYKYNKVIEIDPGSKGKNIFSKCRAVQPGIRGKDLKITTLITFLVYIKGKKLTNSTFQQSIRGNKIPTRISKLKLFYRKIVQSIYLISYYGKLSVKSKTELIEINYTKLYRSQQSLTHTHKNKPRTSTETGLSQRPLPEQA